VSDSYKPNTRAGQYLRVSLDRSGRARSVDEQQVDNERAAERQGWEIVASYADPNRSASRYATRARENYLRLLDDLSKGKLDVLILWESSRGSRKVSEWVELLEVAEHRKVDIYVTSHDRTYRPANHRDRRTLLEDAVDSEYESGKNSSRVKRAVAASADAGRPFGSIPYGYMREYEPGSISPTGQVPDPDTAPIVQEIVARIIAGDPIHRIAVDLNRRGVPTPQMIRDRRLRREGVQRGGWNNPKIRKLLSSETMAGWRTHQGKRHGLAVWEAIVSQADYAAAIKAINDPNRRTQRGTEPKFLLSGIAECGVCGGWMRHYPNRGRPSYGCAGRDNTNPGHVTRQAAALEAMVVVRVVERLRDPGLAEGLARRRAAADESASKAARELAALHRQLADYEVKAQQGGVLAASFERVALGIAQQIEAAQARLVSAAVVPAGVLDLAAPDAAERWAAIGGDIVRMRLIVRSLVQVIVHRSNAPRGSRVFDESSIEIRDR
jgi:site-specific DNA recombinase